MNLTRRAAPAFDPEHHLTASETSALLYGPYVKRPPKHAPGSEWTRWAEEVTAAQADAQLILAAVARKRARKGGKP